MTRQDEREALSGGTVGILDWIKDYAALVISILALCATTFNIYWVNLHKGKLRVGRPRAYEVGIVRGDRDRIPRTVLRLPLVFFNTGAIPIVVQNLRLIYPDEKQYHPFTFIATLKGFTTYDKRAGVPTSPDQERRLAHQFPVRGREALPVICEFWGKAGEILMLEAKTHDVDIYAKLGERDEWKKLVSFKLHVSREAVDAGENDRYVPYNNDPGDSELPAALQEGRFRFW